MTAAQGGSGNNILVLVADDLGVDKVRAYNEGTSPPPTPTVDSLARSGVLFRNAWANPICSPTRACMLTGRHARQTLVGQAIPLFGSGELHLEETTLPEVLDAANTGYAHAQIGKWHLGVETNGGPLAPNRAGWSHFAGMLTGGVHSYYDWDRTVDGVTARTTAYATTKIVDDAITWIRRQNQPWLCVVAFNAPHTPFDAPPHYLHSQNLAGLDPRVTPIPFFNAMVEAMDTEMGRLLSSLGSARQRTNVIFFGDNGTTPEVVQPPFIKNNAKGTPYEGGVNVPLIISGPDVAGRGREVGALVEAVDLFSTMAQLAGADPSAFVPPWFPSESVSMLPYLRNPGQPPLREYVFAEVFDGNTFSSALSSGYATVREKRYKLIRSYNRAFASWDKLFDLRNDPFEQRNLLAAGGLSASQQRVLARLRRELDRLRAPRGQIFPFGTTSCVGSNGAPTIGSLGTPTIGVGYGVTLANAPAWSAATLMVGTSNTRWGRVSLPLALTTLGGGPNCWIYASGESVCPVLTNSAGGATTPVGLPNILDLVGTRLFHCWLVSDLGLHNTLKTTTSDGLAAVIGM